MSSKILNILQKNIYDLDHYCLSMLAADLLLVSQ